MKKKAKFLVSVEIPEEATPEQMRRYIREAIRTWIGSKEPSHPIFNMRRESVNVKQVTEIV